jgi:hypothetical protein
VTLPPGTTLSMVLLHTWLYSHPVPFITSILLRTALMI